MKSNPTRNKKKTGKVEKESIEVENFAGLSQPKGEVALEKKYEIVSNFLAN